MAATFGGSVHDGASGANGGTANGGPGLGSAAYKNSVGWGTMKNKGLLASLAASVSPHPAAFVDGPF